MRLTARLKLGFWLVVCLALLASCATPLPQLTYRGVLPAPVSDPFALAGEFAASLADEAGLQIVDRTRPSGNARIDAAAYVELTTKAAPPVRVTIAAYARDRLVLVTVTGDYRSPQAVEIGQASQRVFAQLHPEATYGAFQAKD